MPFLFLTAMQTGTACRYYTVIPVDDERKSVTYFGTSLDLTRYEYRLLKLFIARPGASIPVMNFSTRRGNSRKRATTARSMRTSRRSAPS